MWYSVSLAHFRDQFWDKDTAWLNFKNSGCALRQFEIFNARLILNLLPKLLKLVRKINRVPLFSNS